MKIYSVESSHAGNSGISHAFVGRVHGRKKAKFRFPDRNAVRRIPSSVQRPDASNMLESAEILYSPVSRDVMNHDMHFFSLDVPLLKRSWPQFQPNEHLGGLKLSEQSNDLKEESLVW
jgi:hypothetical protein